VPSLIAIASKQVQLQEIVACIEHFAIDGLRLHLFNNQGRIGLDSVRSAITEACPKARLILDTFDIADRRAIAAILDQPADVVAFPLYRSSAFYRRAPSLKRRGRTIVHVTDGIGDLFTMWELQRAVIAKTRRALIKGALVIPQLYALRADLEFGLFHPAKTPYAKRSLPVGPFPIAAAKRRAMEGVLKAHQPEALVIDGFDLTAERIAGALGLDRYVATRRDGGVDLSGRVHLEKEVICAEEVLAVMRPDLVVGCPSTSLAAARVVHDDVPTFCVTTPAALHVRGAWFNKVFETYAERFGVVFADAGDADAQLAAIRGLLPAGRRAYA
jgi:hypothetical protein